VVAVREMKSVTRRRAKTRRDPCLPFYTPTPAGERAGQHRIEEFTRRPPSTSFAPT